MLEKRSAAAKRYRRYGGKREAAVARRKRIGAAVTSRKINISWEGGCAPAGWLSSVRKRSHGCGGASEGMARHDGARKNEEQREPAKLCFPKRSPSGDDAGWRRTKRWSKVEDVQRQQTFVSSTFQHVETRRSRLSRIPSPSARSRAHERSTRI